MLDKMFICKALAKNSKEFTLAKLCKNGLTKFLFLTQIKLNLLVSQWVLDISLKLLGQSLMRSDVDGPTGWKVPGGSE